MAKLKFGLEMAGALTLLLWTACASPSFDSEPVTPPPYQRHFTLVLESADFRPRPGLWVDIEVQPPARLVSPTSGRARSGPDGLVTIVVEPLPFYDRTAWAGGDTVVDFPVEALLRIHLSASRVVEKRLSDRESFARYQDPLYQGLNRDPARESAFYSVVVP